MERVKAHYEGQVLKPERALDLQEGEEVLLFIGDPFERVKAHYEGQVLKPERHLPFQEGEVVAALIARRFERLRGILKGVAEDSVALQHTLKDLWGRQGR